MTVNTGVLEQIAHEMTAMATAPLNDPEADHVKADELLVQAITWLAAGEETKITDLTDRITADYERIEKWYA